MLREIRIALLEADVALPVVREFIAGSKKALGQEVLQSLTPGQALVGVCASRTDSADGWPDR
jgi:signal recognition particle subunit SRP54